MSGLRDQKVRKHKRIWGGPLPGGRSLWGPEPSGLRRGSGRVWGQVGCPARPPTPSRASGSPLSPSEGSVIAYYWSEFSIPKYLVEEAERAMAEERVVTLPPRARALSSFVLTSVVAFRKYRDARGGRVLGPSSVEQGQALDRWGNSTPEPGHGREDCLLAPQPPLGEQEAGMRKSTTPVNTSFSFLFFSH